MLRCKISFPATSPLLAVSLIFGKYVFSFSRQYPGLLLIVMFRCLRLGHLLVPPVGSGRMVDVGRVLTLGK
jgi:hypothetical protein